MLYPRESATRRSTSLDGIWRFKVDADTEGFNNKWYESELTDTEPMPVPASYNEIASDPAARDHVGWTWYQRSFYSPERGTSHRLYLRFGSVTHSAVVWIDGKEIGSHKGGYLPFAFDITDHANSPGPHRLTVAVSNVLDWTTLPPGEVVTKDDQDHPEGYKVQEYYHDFFNYGGIHRPVTLLTLPENRVEDISVRTEIDGSDGAVNYQVATAGKGKVRVELFDADGRSVASGNGPTGALVVRDARLWEPGNPYLYTLNAQLVDGTTLLDEYFLPLGIRSVEVKGTQFLINGKPFYFKGFGKHEDTIIRGKGADPATDIRDYNLMRSLGANSFRTSHYPYSEEIMNLADELGFVVIDECPAVGIFAQDGKPTFTEDRAGQPLLDHHKNVMDELIARDKNHPSVVMWSVANEPACWEDAAHPYFKAIIEHTRTLDSSRPVTVVQCGLAQETKILDLVDVTCMNRYYSWYTDPGRLEVIALQLRNELEAMYRKNGKPIIVTEYGADTVEGLHHEPPIMFSEEYQTEMLDRFHQVLDEVEYVVGEHVWNFADFQTKQEVRRVGGNRKGVFTRDRQPKLAARELRKRWSSTGPFGD